MRKLAVFGAVLVVVLMSVTVFADEQAAVIANLGNWSVWARKESDRTIAAALQNTVTVYVNDTAYSVHYGVGIGKGLFKHALVILLHQLNEQATLNVQIRPLANGNKAWCNTTFVGWYNEPLSSTWRTAYYFEETGDLAIELDPLLYSLEAVLSKELRISFQTNVGQVTVVVDISNINNVLTELDLASIGF